MTPRLLAVSNHPIHPTTDGYALRVANLLPELAKEWEVALVTPVYDGGPSVPVGSAAEVRTVPGVGAFGAADRVALQSAFDHMLASWRPDALLLWCGAEYVAFDRPNLPPAIGDRIDCMTLTLWRDRENAHGLREQLEAVRGAAWHARYERRLLRTLDAMVVVGESDARVLRRLSGGAAVHVVPNGVASRGTPDHADEAPTPTVAFTGVLSHQPNVDAALYFAESVWPRVRAEVPAARYVIAGRDPDPALLAIAGRDGIEVHADVPDMHALLRTAWIAVAPMRTGAGIKNKVLEAWAAGKPVVMTEIAANGLSLDAGGDTLVCRDARAMAEQVVRLLRDDQERWRTGDGLHDRVRDAHSWMAAGERLSALLDRVRRGARRGAAVG